MLAIGNYGNLMFFVMIGLSILPILSFFGHIFTSNGREAIRANPFLGLYYIIFFVFAYFFWIEPILIYEYLGIKYTYQMLIYGSLAIVPILEKGLPN